MGLLGKEGQVSVELLQEEEEGQIAASAIVKLRKMRCSRRATQH